LFSWGLERGDAAQAGLAGWNEIDFIYGMSTIPPGRTENARRALRVPLSRELIRLLENLPRLGEYIFPNSKAGKALSNMAMLTLLKKMNRQADGKPRWVDPKSGRPITPHGLRATFRAWGEDAGFSRDLLEESLGHQIGNAVERAYRRTDSFDRRREVMQAWANFCCDERIGPTGGG
jgi:integrase